jgi:capsular exopolysaccharide synthesis family protein
VENTIKAPVIGTIPHYAVGKEKRALMVRDRPKSAVAESFRHLRTNHQFMMSEEGAKVIAVTSTVAAEGKTSISSNLAAILHLLDKKVIILNFDLRKPTLHTLFGVPNSKGLSAYLSGHATGKEIIVPTPYAGLDIIPAGPTPPNPSELIASSRTETLLNALKEDYDVIVLDTPPVGLVTDARALLTHADAVVYTLRAGYSKKEFLKTVQSLYEHDNIHGFGVVINDMKMNQHGYGYGYGYGYYEET